MTDNYLPDSKQSPEDLERRLADMAILPADSKQSPEDLERRLADMAILLRERNEEISILRQKLSGTRGKETRRKSKLLLRRRGSLGFSGFKSQSDNSDIDISSRSEDSAIESSQHIGRRMSPFKMVSKSKLRDLSPPSSDVEKGFSAKKTHFSVIAKPAGYAVRQSVGILDKTVDIGHKGFKKVLKSTAEAGKKTGRFFGIKTERGKRLSIVKAKSALSKWDNAVEIIDKLLGDESNGLDIHEKDGLKDIQELLLKGMENEVEKTYHIPINLLESRGSQRLSLNAKTYVLKEYGGITQRKTRPALVRQNGVRDSTRTNFLVGDEWDDSVPSEFVNLSQEKRRKIYEMLKWDNLKRWDFDIFELNEVSEGHPLVLMAWAVLGAPHAQRAMAKACDLLVSSDNDDFRMGYNFVESEIKIPLERLSLYFRLVEDHYRPNNPYHNAIHAADVLQTLNTLIQMGKDEIKLNDEELFSILLAAVVHDVDHPGLNNSFQVAARTKLALQYNDISVLENYHASMAFTMMIKSSPFGEILSEDSQFLDDEMSNLNVESDFNILSNTDAEQFAAIKAKTIDAILHTDMKLHFQTVSKIKGLIINEEKQGESEAVWNILTFMLHMADISNAAKPGHISRQWTDRCLDEFFTQGDREKMLGMEPSPQCNRDNVSKADSQVGFIQFVVQPAYEVLACIIPEVKNVVIPHMEENRRYWESRSKDRRLPSA